jgi:eukaryotic-like serine/threonine-protein kinase
VSTNVKGVKVTKQEFGQRYRVTERIGMGGMAEVFKAVDTTLGRTVALKVMLPQYANDKTFAARFRQEAQAAANLSSPYIVNIYDWGKDEDSYYIVMEYVRGTDLKTAIQQRGAIHQRKVAEIGAQVCSALSVAHSYDIIHRDIKSANIMVQTDGNIKVMDFGIAQAGNSAMTQDSSVLGTAHYVSPEQAQGHALTPASDLYSLGIVMYEAATGQLPFDGTDAVSVALKQVNEAPIPPHQLNPAIDKNLENIIMRALSKHVETRYQTANEMKRDLEAYLAGASVAAAKTTVIPNASQGYNAGTTTVMPHIGDEDAARGSYYDQDGGQQQKKKKNSKVKIIIAIVVVLVLAGAGYGIASAMGVFAEKVIVPDVRGMTLDEAKTELTSYNLTVGKVDYEPSNTVEKDHVISQDPKANGSAESGGAISLVVSSGEDESNKVDVPNLKGLSSEDAQSMINSAGLIASVSETYSDSNDDKGKVISQDPKANTKVDKGSTINITVSLGAKDEYVEVPNVIGMKKNAAISAIKDAGLYVDSSTEESETVAKGRVVSQTPNGGSLKKGDTVTLVISSGAPASTTPDSGTDDPNSGSGSSTSN